MSEPGVDADLYQVDIERFHGPLDLLLHLIRTQDIDVFDIPIARITGQFVAAIRGVQSLSLEKAGEFLEMAAQLVQIKLRMLFPADGAADEEGEDPRADLVRRLLEYEHFREASDRLGEAEQRRAAHFGKGYHDPRPVAEPERELAPLDAGLDDLLTAAVELTDSRDIPEPEIRIQGRPIPIEEKIRLIRDALVDEERIEFARLVEPWSSRPHTIAALLACLELARHQSARIRQRVPFAPLWILRPAAEPVEEA